MQRYIGSISRNGRILLAAKAVRGFAIGLGTVAVGAYLAQTELSRESIPLILSAGLLGSLAQTALVARWGDELGRRRALIAGSFLMVIAVAVPLSGEHPALLGLVFLSGGIAVSNGDFGLHTIDQPAFAETVPPPRRVEGFAAYSLAGTAGSAIGAAALIPLLVVSTSIGLADGLETLPAFILYAVCGLLCVALFSQLDQGIELSSTSPSSRRRLRLHKSRQPVVGLSALFAVDGLAGGFVVQAYLAFWFVETYAIDPVVLGALFGICGVVTALTIPASSVLAGRVGLVGTMVWSSLAANLLLIAMAVAPDLQWAALLLVLRSLFSTLDVPARHAYTMTLVTADERTATAGLTSMSRAVGLTVGPGLAGAVLVPIGLGAPLLAAGILKSAYAIALFSFFRHLDIAGRDDE